MSMKTSVSAVSGSGSTVHVLSHVKFVSSAKGKESDSFFALQFRPAEPLLHLKNCEFILSKVKSPIPDFKYDLEEKVCSDRKRFMVIPSNRWGTGQEAFDIALSCQQNGADGVIISLPGATLKNSVFGPESTIKATAEDLSRTTFSKLETLNIPVLALMPEAIKYLQESRKKGHFNVQIGSLTKSFHGGEDNIADDLIGNGPLDVPKLKDFRSQLATKYSAYNFNSKGLQRCYKRLIEVMDRNTFPLGMEMEAEIFTKCSKQDIQFSRHVWAE